MAANLGDHPSSSHSPAPRFASQEWGYNPQTGAFLAIASSYVSQGKRTYTCTHTHTTRTNAVMPQASLTLWKITSEGVHTSYFPLVAPCVQSPSCHTHSHSYKDTARSHTSWQAMHAHMQIGLTYTYAGTQRACKSQTNNSLSQNGNQRKRKALGHILEFCVMNYSPSSAHNIHTPESP